jgi:transposase
MKIRVMQTNALRCLLYEFGIVLPEGQEAATDGARGLGGGATASPGPGRVGTEHPGAASSCRRFADGHRSARQATGRDVKQSQQMSAVQAIPGIGPLSATALVATATDITAFKSGRQFAAWLGLTPRQVGTGGKTQQLGISKRGDAYVRSLLIHGARSIVSRSVPASWIGRLQQRRHFNVAVAAMANKMTRTAWAVLAKGSAFDGLKWAPNEPTAA